MAISSLFLNGSIRYLYQNDGYEVTYPMRYNLGESEVVGLIYTHYRYTMTLCDVLEITLQSYCLRLNQSYCAFILTHVCYNSGLKKAHRRLKVKS